LPRSPQGSRSRARAAASRRDRGLPFLQPWQGGALDREFEAALDDRGERNLGEREFAEREPLALGELAVENLELLVERLHLFGEVRGSRLGCVLGVLEHRHVGRIERAEIPVHPALDHGLFGGRRAVQGGRMQRREIAHDRVGLPDHQVAVDHGRHLGVGIERAVGVGLGVAELAAVIFARIGNMQLFQQEEHLLDVSRRLPSEQLDHAMSSFLLSTEWCMSSFRAQLSGTQCYPLRGL
jgi:hypothetical protein